jgi:hypothetical protein
MISGQLGNAQLGWSELGAETFFTAKPAPPPGTPAVVNISAQTLMVIVLPDYFRIMKAEG